MASRQGNERSRFKTSQAFVRFLLDLNRRSAALRLLRANQLWLCVFSDTVTHTNNSARFWRQENYTHLSSLGKISQQQI